MNKIKKVEWKDVPNYEGMYQVSNEGEVRSLDRGNRKGRVMKLTTSGQRGYLAVRLSLNGKASTTKIHTLVAMAFLGHEPCGMKRVVDHIDNDLSNNNVNNLQVITCRENISKERRGRGTSKYVGVSWYKTTKKWIAQIVIEGKHCHLGFFKDELKARDAYQSALNRR